MGEAQRKKKDARSIAFAKTDKCIYCGGHTLATTVDHCPPKSAFKNKAWPENFVFPACVACNNGASNDDKLLALATRFYPAEQTEEDLKFLNHIGAELWRDYPDEMRFMTGLTGVEKRKALDRLNIPPIPRRMYRHLELARWPARFMTMIQHSIKRILKAIHFQETGQICPAQSVFMISFISNVDFANADNTKELQIMGRSHALQRANKDLSDQFSYAGARTPDLQLAMYLLQFNRSFQIKAAYSATPDGLDFLRDAIRAGGGEPADLTPA